MPITEERQILFEGNALLPEPITQSDTWANGRHSTRVEFTIPTGVDPGAYTFSLGLAYDSGRQQKSAIFLIR